MYIGCSIFVCGPCLLVAVIFMTVAFNIQPYRLDMFNNMTLTQCHVTGGTVKLMNNRGYCTSFDDYVAIWNSSGISTLETFTKSFHTEKEAREYLDTHPDGTVEPCMCSDIPSLQTPYPTIVYEIQCDMLTQCYFDIDWVNETKADVIYRKYVQFILFMICCAFVGIAFLIFLCLASLDVYECCHHLKYNRL